MALLKYRLDTGLIDAVIQSSSLGLTQAQIVPDDPVYGYLLTDEGHDPRLWQTQYAIVDGEVSAKDAVTITAIPNPFVADAVATCTVTVDPFVECTLIVNGAPIALTTGDPTLILTSDVPAVFVIALQALATTWATPITVEAT